MTNVLITMAGAGKRFRDAGYRCAKYRIEVRGKSLFTWAMLSLSHYFRDGSTFVFMVRGEDAASGFIDAECEKLGISGHVIVELNQATDGQATTALMAEPQLRDPSSPILIYNIDTFVHPDALDARQIRGEGWIPCFDGKGDGWSFAKTDASGRVLELREKQRISSHATIGLYWFSSFQLYKEAYHSYYSVERNVEKGEKYVAPLYNEIIHSGHPVFIHEIAEDMVIPLGTPQEVDAFTNRDLPVVAC